MKVPEWAELVKTSKSKEQGPYDPDWFYVRCGEDSSYHMHFSRYVVILQKVKVFSY